jgi:hypothetical protein
MLTLTLSDCGDSIGKATAIVAIIVKINNRLRIARGNSQNLEEGFES